MVELEEIEKAVSKKQIFEPVGAEPLPDEIVDLEKVIENAPSVAPVFIKIDKYKEILQRIHDLKSSIEKIDDILRVRKNMHEINMRSEEALEKSFQQFANATNSFKREFVVARGIQFYPEDKAERKMDDHISKLSDEILKLKEELDSLEI